MIVNKKLSGAFHNDGIISVTSRQIGYEIEEDLVNKTGFPWCEGQPDQPQGIFWADDQFVVVDNASKYNR